MKNSGWKLGGKKIASKGKKEKEIITVVWNEGGTKRERGGER